MPAIETAGAFNAETTSPARSPVRNRGRETPGNAGISATAPENAETPGLVGWGIRIRTSVWRNQTPVSLGNLRVRRFDAAMFQPCPASEYIFRDHKSLEGAQSIF